jgi:uncharacterized protein (TIGR01244 family)
MSCKPGGLLVVLGILIAVPVVWAQGEPAAVESVELGLDLKGSPVRVEDVDGVAQNLYRDGRVWIGGQPSMEALQTLHETGVTAVVNLRTPAEMEDRERVPYDEAAAVAQLGMEYVWIPLGGEEHPYTPAAVERFAQVVAEHPGPVFLHCTMGWRASYLWTAYLIRYQGLTLGQALDRGEAMAISPSPLAGLLDRSLAVVYADASPP